MKKFLLASAIVLSALFALSCSGDDDNYNEPEFPNPDAQVSTQVYELPLGFSFKEYFQPSVPVRGVIILAHGDGGDIDDSTLNGQCHVLAQQNFVAITTSFRSPDSGTQEEVNQRFREDIEAVIAHVLNDFDVARSKVVIGGLSRGGNLTFSQILPSQPGIQPIAGIKGAILECSGGDEWKGSALLYPVAWMSNQQDDVLGMDNANDFKTGLENNQNPGVSAMSECLIIPGSGHCGSSNQYRAFVVEKMLEWFP